MIRAAATYSILFLALAGTALADDTPSAAHSLAQKFAGTTAKKAAERPTDDYETDMLRRARAEQAEAQAAATPSAAPPAAAAPAPAVEPPARLTNAPAAAPPMVPKPSVSEAQVEAKAEVPQAPRPVPLTTPESEKRATLLLAIEMSGSSKMAEMFRTLDPILCAGDICYVSNGLEGDAVRLARKDALKLKDSGEASENSCRGMAGCVFRNVGLPAGAQLKLVALSKGFRIESHALGGGLDATCEITDAGLVCDNPLTTTDFRIWVVPEAVAKTAGIEAIEDAVAAGLPEEDVARTTDK